MSEPPGVWVFNGSRASFPSGVFRDLETAQSWIRSGQLSGTLTWYPLDVCAYDWAVAAGHFVPKREEHSTPTFIQSFSSAAQPHYHYEEGTSGGDGDGGSDGEGGSAGGVGDGGSDGEGE